MQSNLQGGNIGPLSETGNNLSEEVANLRMLSILGVKQDGEAFDQYEFNRSVTRALEKILKHMGSHNIA